MDDVENKSFEVKVKKEIDEDGCNSEMIYDYTSIDSIKQECKQEVDWDCIKDEHLNSYDENLEYWPSPEINFTIPQEQRIFQCPECTVKTKYASNLTKHIISMHPQNKSIANNSSLSAMRRMQNTIGHITDNSLPIEHCKKNLSFPNKKLTEYETVRSTKRFFNRNQSLIKRKYAYSCSNCSFNCNIKQNLIFHVYEYHFGDKDLQNKNLAPANKNFSVCPHCNKNLYRHANPESHVVYCSKVRILQCDYCLRYLRGKYKMESHIFGKHFKDGILQTKFFIHYYLPACPKCGKRYTHRERLCSHIASCGKELPFQCGTCLYETLSKYNLAKHILQQHLKKNNLCQDL